MRKTVFIFCLVFSCLLTHAQKKSFRQGAYVTNQGDTMWGYIFLPETGSSLKFKTTQNGAQPVDVPIEDLKSLQIKDGSYLIWYGKRSVSWLDPFELEVMNADSFRTEIIMLRPVYEGPKYSLYEYRDETERFFIGYGGIIEELRMNYRKLSESEHKRRSLYFMRPSYTVFAVYRDQITRILGGDVSSDERKLINHTDYNLQHLKKLIREMENW
ncbi:hypothetical protein [Pollutibacter soli]|uniref:hypothetical protein n=1 Tax=Pollutibacter soli TaxID=3034157 RepID=UPI00301324FD